MKGWVVQRPKADAIEGAAEPSRARSGEPTTDGVGVMEACLNEGATEGAMEPWRWRSHSLSFARTSMFSNGAACASLTQSRVPSTRSSKKKDDAARRDAYFTARA